MSGQSRGRVLSFVVGLSAVGSCRSAHVWAKNSHLSASKVLNRESNCNMCEREAGIEIRLQNQLVLLGEWSGLQADSYSNALKVWTRYLLREIILNKNL